MQICGVTEKTVYNNANKANVILEHGKSYDWTEEEVKRLQLVLMKNAPNAGGQKTYGSVVKSTVESTFQSGLTIQELIRSGNVEAIKEFTQMAIEASEQVKEACTTVFQLGTLANVALTSGNIEAKKYLIETI